MSKEYTWQRYLKDRRPASRQERRELQAKYNSYRRMDRAISFMITLILICGLSAFIYVYFFSEYRLEDGRHSFNRLILILGQIQFAIAIPAFFIFFITPAFVSGKMQSPNKFNEEIVALKEKLESISGYQIEDSRKPILIIRSFEDDHLGVYDEPAYIGNSYIPPRYKSTLLKAVENICRNHGPVITSNNPDQYLQTPGGKPIYLLIDNWKNEIEEIMNECSLIVAILGISPGFLWELEKVIASGCLEKLIIFLPDEPSKRWDDFLRAIREQPNAYPRLLSMNIPAPGNSRCILMSDSGSLEPQRISLRERMSLFLPGATKRMDKRKQIALWLADTITRVS